MAGVDLVDEHILQHRFLMMKEVYLLYHHPRLEYRLATVQRQQWVMVQLDHHPELSHSGGSRLLASGVDKVLRHKEEVRHRAVLAVRTWRT